MTLNNIDSENFIQYNIAIKNIKSFCNMFKISKKKMLFYLDTRQKSPFKYGCFLCELYQKTSIRNRHSQDFKNKYICDCTNCKNCIFNKPEKTLEFLKNN